MSNLITEAEFVALRDISKKVDSGKVKEAIGLAQDSDLQDVLGGFYFDVLSNADEASYAGLLNGSAFTYEDEAYVHKGLKAVLADYTYGRYMYIVNINLTPFGAQSKFTDDSNSVDRGTIRDVSKQAQVDAGIKFKTVQKYILSKPDIFSRYCKENRVNTGFNSIRISKL